MDIHIWMRFPDPRMFLHFDKVQTHIHRYLVTNTRICMLHILVSVPQFIVNIIKNMYVKYMLV